MWFPIRSDTNRPVQEQKIDRNLKYRNYVEEELYYPSSENKGADQFRSYCEAGLRQCFRIDRLLVFPCGGSIIWLHCENMSMKIILSRIPVLYASSSVII